MAKQAKRMVKMLLANSSLDSLVEEIQDSAASSIRGGVGVMGTGNFNVGTAADDIFVIRKNFGTNNLTWVIGDFAGATTQVNYGTTNDILFIGDFNNDGFTDLGKVSINGNGFFEFEADTNLDGTSDLSRTFGVANVDSPFGKGFLR